MEPVQSGAPLFQVLATGMQGIGILQFTRDRLACMGPMKVTNGGSPFLCCA
jgi:hypothetical protein